MRSGWMYSLAMIMHVKDRIKTKRVQHLKTACCADQDSKISKANMACSIISTGHCNILICKALSLRYAYLLAFSQAYQPIGKWIIKDEIGRGSFASVWRAEARDIGNIDESVPSVVAIKIIRVNRVSHKLKIYLENEIRTLFKIRHENVIELYDSVITDQHICLITEYCSGGELTILCREGYRQKYDDDQLILIIKQLIDGIHHIHSMGYVHRDIKPQNILITDSGIVKLADFGFVCDLSTEETTETLCGSPMYMAPEILLQKRYNASVDIWSLGVVIYELFENRPPFPGVNSQDLLRLIRRDLRSLRFSSKMPVDIQCLLVDMLIPFPEQRLTSEELANAKCFKTICSRVCQSSLLPLSQNCPDLNSLIFPFSDSKLSEPKSKLYNTKNTNGENVPSSKSVYYSNKSNLMISEEKNVYDIDNSEQITKDSPLNAITPDDFVLVTSASQTSFFRISPETVRRTQNACNSPSSLSQLSSLLGASPAKVLKSWAQFMRWKPKRAKALK